MYNSDLLPDEKTFPIYVFTAKWAENGVQDPNYPKWFEGLPEGRIWNSTSDRLMVKEEIGLEELTKKIGEWWLKIQESRVKKDVDKEKLKFKPNELKDIELKELVFKLKEHEVWNLTWFQHETFDLGQDDLTVLDSFERFVQRKEELAFNDPDGSYPLMGAEDRWRWHGAEPNGDRNDNSPAPCRCKFCKEQGKIRIAH